ncbi:hypothetical protein [Streptomyces glomeratus]|uniref:HTH HARE-type domain-containing protein n=1 Tax=Streptomyces glomeratus TaxID=284452 RepID=A0ABP6LPR2_9ACTN|nr:hypothetical protein [Streptomyces glomeratus]MCF1512753.1 hypothetical protein [Streptomyces glomeratus]
MPSVVGLLEEHELAARRRVDELREEADRVQAELAAAEQEWQEWMIARQRVSVLLSVPTGAGIADDAMSPVTASTRQKPQVPVWREGLAWSALSVDYQRILKTLADRSRLGQGPLTCQEMAALFGMEVVPARVEAPRSKAKRLVARGWLAEDAPSRFTLARGVSGPGGGS